MKYTTATRAILLASIASTLLGSASAVPRPGPASKAPKTKNDSSKASTGLLVDQEGNLYSPRTTKTANAKNVICIRGGALCVDNEGNLYTPTKDTSPTNILRDETSSSAAASRTKAASPAPPSSTLRGGSHNHNLGGLGVDQEGNLFATQGRASALLLRGGDLSVDNEGNLYTPLFVKPTVPLASSNRRSGAHDAVLLTKNRLPKKTAVSSKAKKSLPSDHEALAFIGYNNALMET